MFFSIFFWCFTHGFGKGGSDICDGIDIVSLSILWGMVSRF